MLLMSKHCASNKPRLEGSKTMTLPDERRRAILHTKGFLLDLCNPRATPRVPKKVREEARRLLKHYPINENELEKLGV